MADQKLEKRLRAIEMDRARLEKENLLLQEQIKASHHYSEMIGTSEPALQVMQMISMVAASETTVLILGETGTGKELVAKAIHAASPRRHRLMIRVNCAALPPNLVESELFGHEKGSFTGATERRIGKFELANGSTLFLDEIGELPPLPQAKLLRAIQEREIERVGGNEMIKTDTRIITATNRNLVTEVEAGRFRSDLFYRLNVFPIQLPPLRERKEDIPLLADHFIRQHSRRSGKQITGISPKAIQQLMRYEWPGNIRELEHLIERSLLIASGDMIKDIQLSAAGKGMQEKAGAQPVKTLKELERDHILAVLKRCDYKVGGPGGAAALLKMPATTLHSRIKQLKIKKGLV